MYCHQRMNYAIIIRIYMRMNQCTCVNIHTHNTAYGWLATERHSCQNLALISFGEWVLSQYASLYDQHSVRKRRGPTLCVCFDIFDKMCRVRKRCASFTTSSSAISYVRVIMRLLIMRQSAHTFTIHACDIPPTRHARVRVLGATRISQSTNTFPHTCLPRMHPSGAVSLLCVCVYTRNIFARYSFRNVIVQFVGNMFELECLSMERTIARKWRMPHANMAVIELS